MTEEQRFMLNELIEVDEILTSPDHCFDEWTKTFITDLKRIDKENPSYQLSEKQADKLLEKWKEHCDD